MTSGELKDLAVSGAHMSGAQKRAYHKAWVRGEINFDH